MSDRHVPVLLEETMTALQLRPGKQLIDCTLGDAGHAEKILQATAPNGTLLGIDADPESLLRAKQFLYPYEGRVVFIRDNFESLQRIAETAGFTSVDGILMDFGWSSPQFSTRGRGFSFQQPSEPLDMRYSAGEQHDKKTAAELLNELSKEELEYILKTYGEEGLSREIAYAFIEKRKQKSFETVADLLDVVLTVYRNKLHSDKEVPWVGGLHPATKVFQALRIAVNDELGVIETVLPQAIALLKSGGRLAVITFHSLEDRIVKHYFKSKEHTDITIITKKPIVCGEAEFAANPPSRSAKLRVIEKI